MGDYIYVEKSLVARLYRDVLVELPTREKGEAALDWLERCDEKMADWLSVGHVTRDFAERALGAAETLAAELQRIPQMVDWCHREYMVAVINGLDPADDKARYQLASQYEFPEETEDDFLERFFLGLLGDA